MAAELDKYTDVFSSNLNFPGLFISPKCCHTAAFLFVLIDNTNKFIGCRHIGFCNWATAIIKLLKLCTLKPEYQWGLTVKTCNDR